MKKDGMAGMHKAKQGKGGGMGKKAGAFSSNLGKGMKGKSGLQGPACK
jgi:hypothetical protein